MDVAVGQKVWYVPHLDHRFDKDHVGNRVFAWEFVGDSHNQRMPYRKGDPVDFGHPALGAGLMHGTDTPGVLRTGAGHHIRPTAPLAPWPAIVREVYPDGTVRLDIAHPVGGSLQRGHDFDNKFFLILGYPGAGVAKSGLKYSTDFEPHTWHFLEDAKEK